MQTLRALAEERNAFVAWLAALARAHDLLTIEHDRAALHELADQCVQIWRLVGRSCTLGPLLFLSQYGRAGRGHRPRGLTQAGGLQAPPRL